MINQRISNRKTAEVSALPTSRLRLSHFPPKWNWRNSHKSKFLKLWYFNHLHQSWMMDILKIQIISPQIYLTEILEQDMRILNKFLRWFFFCLYFFRTITRKKLNRLTWSSTNSFNIAQHHQSLVECKLKLQLRAVASLGEDAEQGCSHAAGDEVKRYDHLGK